MKILVVTSSNDLTVDYIIDRYGDEVNFFRLNTDMLDQYHIAVGTKYSGWTIETRYQRLTEWDTKAIYYRKPVLPQLNDYDSRFHGQMYREILMVIEGIIERFDKICLSKPSVLRKADNKIVQLKIAEEIGFNIPPSLITNSSLWAQEFNNHFESIVKPIAVGEIRYGDMKGVMQTNKVDRSIPITGLELSPTYFQEYVLKDYEVRLTVVGDEFFPVKIETPEKIDWRKSNDLKYSMIEIPTEVKEKCIRFLKELNLEFGAFDFIVSDGKFTFLEVNANGQWAWLEDEVGIDISYSIIKYLTKGMRIGE